MATNGTVPPGTRVKYPYNLSLGFRAAMQFQPNSTSNSDSDLFPSETRLIFDPSAVHRIELAFLREPDVDSIPVPNASTATRIIFPASFRIVTRSPRSSSYKSSSPQMLQILKPIKFAKPRLQISFPASLQFNGAGAQLDYREFHRDEYAACTGTYVYGEGIGGDRRIEGVARESAAPIRRGCCVDWTHRNDCRARLGSRVRALQELQHGRCMHGDSTHTTSTRASSSRRVRRETAPGSWCQVHSTRAGAGALCGSVREGGAMRDEEHRACALAAGGSRVGRGWGWRAIGSGDVGRWRGSVWRTHPQAPARRACLRAVCARSVAPPYGSAPRVRRGIRCGKHAQEHEERTLGLRCAATSGGSGWYFQEALCGCTYPVRESSGPPRPRHARSQCRRVEVLRRGGEKRTLESRGGKVMWGEGWRRRWPLAACERAPSAYGTRRGPALCGSSGDQTARRARQAIKAVVQRGCLSKRGQEDDAGAGAKEEAEDADEDGEFVEVEENG
ncbi:hypothetical protein C8F04DRAFT_1242785 [Mycena alexandri]|uniref:Uncharacterized protein n=1 Tax=Mycena alexandri TaxID=1745969 RepID=A0AAD6WLZ5_9AGAR|nr:hypothetical protein C8F04DRAFT_1242785 [Mycena alexandri]